MKKLNKVAAALLTLSLLLSMAVPVFAAQTTVTKNLITSTTDTTTVSNGGIVYIPKKLDGGTDEKSVNMSFTLNPGNSGAPSNASPDSSKIITVTNSPLTITKTDISSVDAANSFQIKLPTYTVPGIYQYTLTEASSATYAGVTDSTNLASGTTSYTLYVYALADGENGAIGTVKAALFAGNTTSSGDVTTNVKESEITNIYESGSLKVTKVVEGNGGDRNQYFPIQVTFNAPTSETVVSTIGITGTAYTADPTVNESAESISEIAYSEWSGKSSITKTIYLNGASNNSVTFANIPEGVTYTVSELGENSSAVTAGNGVLTVNNITYDVAYKGKTGTGTEQNVTGSQISGTISNKTTDTATVTNTNGITINTGVILDTAPYVLVLAVVAVGVVLMTVRRRHGEE